MKCINNKIKKGKVTFDFLRNIVSSVQANLFTQSGTIQGRPSSISDFNNQIYKERKKKFKNIQSIFFFN
jgi:hypothetical protein